MPFEPHKTIKEQGIDTTRKFRVEVYGTSFPFGTIVTLEKDDGSSSPAFTDGTDWHYVDFEDLEYADNEPITWSNLEYDKNKPVYFVNEDGLKIKLLGLCGEVIMTDFHSSGFISGNRVNFWTKEALISAGYSIEQPKKELTKMERFEKWLEKGADLGGELDLNCLHIPVIINKAKEIFGE